MREIHTLDSVKIRVNEIFGNKYTIPFQEINGVKNKIKVYCKDCNEIFNIRLNTLLYGYGCSKCKYNKIRLSLNNIRNRSNELYGNKYYIKEQEMRNNKSIIEVHCNDCNENFNIVVYGHLKGNGGCKKCAIKNRTMSIY